MNGKRGISSVVTTVLLLLIGIAAIAIIGTLILGFIRTNTERLELGINFVELTINDSSVRYGPSTLDLRIARNNQAGNISGVNVILMSDSGNSYTYYYNKSILELESKTIQIPLSELNGKISKIIKISVAPVASTKSGKKIPGDKTDEYIVGKGFVSTQGLILYLPFDNDLKDYSGNNNNGQCSGSSCPTQTFGQVKGAYEFNGISNVISIPFNNSLYLNGENETVILWIKPKGNNMTDQGTFMQNNMRSRRLFYNSSNYFSFILVDINIPNGYHSLLSPFSSIRDSWHYVGYTVRDNNFSLYIDGNIAYSKNSNYPIIPANSAWTFGSLDSGAIRYFFNGTMDEIRIYNKSLSDEEIYYLYKYN
jgi:hypothetical protein